VEFGFPDEFFELIYMLGLCVRIDQHDAFHKCIEKCKDDHADGISVQYVPRNEFVAPGSQLDQRPWTCRLFQRAYASGRLYVIDLVLGIANGDITVLILEDRGVAISFLRDVLYHATALVRSTSQIPEAVQMALLWMYSRKPLAEVFPHAKRDAWNMCLGKHDLKWMYTSLCLQKYAAHVPVADGPLAEPCMLVNGASRVSYTPCEINYVYYALGQFGMLNDTDAERLRLVNKRMTQQRTFLSNYFLAYDLDVEAWAICSERAMAMPSVLSLHANSLGAALAAGSSTLNAETVKAIMFYDEDDSDTEDDEVRTSAPVDADMPGFYQNEQQMPLLHSDAMFGRKDTDVALTAACFSVIAYVESTGRPLGNRDSTRCDTCRFDFACTVKPFWTSVRPALRRLRDIVRGRVPAMEVVRNAVLCIGCSTLCTLVMLIARRTLEPDFPLCSAFPDFHVQRHFEEALHIYKHVGVALDLHRVPWSFRDHAFVPAEVTPCGARYEVRFPWTPQLLRDFTLDTLVLALRMVAYGPRFSDPAIAKADEISLLDDGRGIALPKDLWRFVCLTWNPALRLPNHAIGKGESLLSDALTEDTYSETSDFQVNAGEWRPADNPGQSPRFVSAHKWMDWVPEGDERRWDPVKALGWPHALRMLLCGDTTQVYHSLVWLRRLLISEDTMSTAGMWPNNDSIYLARLLPAFLCKALRAADLDDAFGLGEASSSMLTMWLWGFVHSWSPRVMVSKRFIARMQHVFRNRWTSEPGPGPLANAIALCAHIQATYGSAKDPMFYSVPRFRVEQFCVFEDKDAGVRLQGNVHTALMLLVLCDLCSDEDALLLLQSVVARTCWWKKVWPTKKRTTRRKLADISPVCASKPQGLPRHTIVWRRLRTLKLHTNKYYRRADLRPIPADQEFCGVRVFGVSSIVDCDRQELDSWDDVETAAALFRVLEGMTYFSKAERAEEVTVQELLDATELPEPAGDIVLDVTRPLATLVNMGNLQFSTHGPLDMFPVWASMFRDTEHDVIAHQILAPKTTSLLPLHGAHPGLLRALLFDCLDDLDTGVFEQQFWKQLPDMQQNVLRKSADFEHFLIEAGLSSSREDVRRVQTEHAFRYMSSDFLK
jgi:hypothetical protein